MTLNGVTALILSHFTEFDSSSVAHCVGLKVVADIGPIRKLSATEM